MIREGHGPLENILTNYTLAHVNRFLAEIDRRSRGLFIENITSARIAQATDKSYREVMGKLRQRERVIAMNEARRNGTKRQFQKTQEEIEKLESQEHVWLADMSLEEQEKFRAEQQQMWDQIPEHLREKAEKLAGR